MRPEVADILRQMTVLLQRLADTMEDDGAASRTIRTGSSRPLAEVMTPMRSPPMSPSVVSPETAPDTARTSIARRWSRMVLRRRASWVARSRSAAGMDRYSAAPSQSLASARRRNDCSAARGDAGDTIDGALSALGDREESPSWPRACRGAARPAARTPNAAEMRMRTRMLKDSRVTDECPGWDSNPRPMA